MVVRQYVCAAKNNNTRMRKLNLSYNKRKHVHAWKDLRILRNPFIFFMVSGKQWRKIQKGCVLITVATPKRFVAIVHSFVYRQCTSDSK